MIDAEILKRLAALSLPTRAFQEVLSILADMQAAGEAGRATSTERVKRFRKRHSNVSCNVSETQNETLCNVSCNVSSPSPLISPVPPSSSPPHPPSNNPLTPSDPPSPIYLGGRSATRPAIDQAFEEFWREYPRREGANPRAPAAKKFAAALKAGSSVEEIVAGARAYRTACDEGKLTGTPMVAQAITWLNQQRWTDYGPAAEPKARADPAPTAEQLELRRQLIEEGERILNGGGKGFLG